jgi:hypothetical protein
MVLDCGLVKGSFLNLFEVSEIRCLTFSKNNKYLAFASKNCIKVIDLGNNEVCKSYTNLDAIHINSI